MRKKKRKTIRIHPALYLIGAILVIVAGVVGTQDRHPSKMKEQLKLHHRELIEIVKKVKASSVPLGSERYFRVNSRIEPNTLMRTDLLHEDGFSLM
jgi:hypothetical protein